jgi:hypothetical protein
MQQDDLSSTYLLADASPGSILYTILQSACEMTTGPSEDMNIKALQKWRLIEWRRRRPHFR